MVAQRKAGTTVDFHEPPASGHGTGIVMEPSSDTRHTIATLVLAAALAGCGSSVVNLFPDGGARDAAVRDWPDVPQPPPGVTMCSGAECRTGEACCLSDGHCYDRTDPAGCPTPPRTTDPGACTSNEQCAPTEFCDYRLCEGAGTCRLRNQPTACRGYSGVCGCDGRTYASPCEAWQAGARVSNATISRVACGARASRGIGGILPCSDRQPCPAAGPTGPTWHCDPSLPGCVMDQVVFACGFDAQCPTGESCCGLTGLCYNPADPSLCQVPPAGAALPCSSNGYCFLFGLSFCDGPGCGPGGGCFSPRQSCSGVLEPVCGCNGRTYNNDCWASNDGIRVAHAGACP